MVDAALLRTMLLPSSNSNASTESWDLGQGPHIERLELRLEVEALPNLVDAKTVTVKVQDSADNNTFADVAEMAPIVMTGAGGVGAAAVSKEFRFPPTIRRYARVNVAVMTAGGTNTDKTMTATLLA